MPRPAWIEYNNSIKVELNVAGCAYFKSRIQQCQNEQEEGDALHKAGGSRNCQRGKFSRSTRERWLGDRQDPERERPLARLAGLPGLRRGSSHLLLLPHPLLPG